MEQFLEQARQARQHLPQVVAHAAEEYLGGWPRKFHHNEVDELAAWTCRQVFTNHYVLTLLANGGSALLPLHLARFPAVAEAVKVEYLATEAVALELEIDAARLICQTFLLEILMLLAASGRYATDREHLQRRWQLMRLRQQLYGPLNPPPSAA